MKKTTYLLLTIGMFLMLLATVSCEEKESDETLNPDLPVEVPTEGNTWLFTNPDSGTPQVMNPGSQSWTDPDMVHRTFFRINQTGEVHIGIQASTEGGTSQLEASFAGNTTQVEVSQQQPSEVFIGTFEVDQPGYYHLDIQGVSKETLEFALISDVLLGGAATTATVQFIDEDYFYWGRRGPSVHMSYEVPESASDILWYYNEVTVPQDNDVVGSFYMANGFAEGYFGFQVNSETERRVLFSVWSPYQTDNPDEIPDDQRVDLLMQGQNVTVNDFGNEGSGGQSYLQYDWQAGNTYGFLLRGQPAGDNKTDYTAWFYAPEEDTWMLIASWRRPLTDTYLERPHSFLENFNTRTGPLERMAYYNNQWIKDTQGNWHELNRARFTADATAQAEARMDYAGGMAGDQEGFFMKNCGFFNETTPVDTWFTRPPLGQQPEVDLEALPMQ